MLSEGSLRVDGAQLSDAGRYYCTVSNQAGSDHRGVDLRVFGKYSKEKERETHKYSGEIQYCGQHVSVLSSIQWALQSVRVHSM